jgi:hypothetical protein
MRTHAELRGFWHRYQNLRHRHAQAADDLGFGYSRSDSDTEPTELATVPDGIDLYFFTGRTRKEAHQ